MLTQKNILSYTFHVFFEGVTLGFDFNLKVVVYNMVGYSAVSLQPIGMLLILVKDEVHFYLFRIPSVWHMVGSQQMLDEKRTNEQQSNEQGRNIYWALVLF